MEPSTRGTLGIPPSCAAQCNPLALKRQCIASVGTQKSILDEQLPNRRCPSTPIKIATSPNEDESQSRNSGSRSQADSGYGSLDSTPRPPSPEQQTLRRRYHGYSAVSRTMWGSWQALEVSVFDDIELLDKDWDRFDDLLQLHGPSLSRVIEEKRNRNETTSGYVTVQHKRLGDTQMAPSPWIVVSCHSSVRKHVQRFFDRPLVRQDLRGGDNPSCHQHTGFEVLVREEPPQQDAAHVPHETFIRVAHRGSGRADKPSTLCGSLVRIEEEHENRLATIGGVLTCTGRNGEAYVCAMTVAHLLRSDCEEKNEPQQIDSGIAASHGGGGNGACLIGQATQSPHSRYQYKSMPWCALGRTIASSDDTYHDIPYNDWALIKLPDEEISVQNLLPRRSRPLKCATPPPRSACRKKRVVQLIGGVSGPMMGYLSLHSAYITTKPSHGFTKVYTMSLANTQASLRPGDCGTWVEDLMKDEVYGHVVASGDSGEAFVVPLKDSISQIISFLGLQNLELLCGIVELRHSSGARSGADDIVEPFANSSAHLLTAEADTASGQAPRRSRSRYAPQTQHNAQTQSSRQHTETDLQAEKFLPSQFLTHSHLGPSAPAFMPYGSGTSDVDTGMRQSGSDRQSLGKRSCDEYSLETVPTSGYNGRYYPMPTQADYSAFPAQYTAYGMHDCDIPFGPILVTSNQRLPQATHSVFSNDSGYASLASSNGYDQSSIEGPDIPVSFKDELAQLRHVKEGTPEKWKRLP